VAFYVVLHHPANPHQPWANAWEQGSTDRIQAITTTAAIGHRAEAEGRVFVHRCGFGADAPAIVAEARVVSATAIDRGTWYLTFETIKTMRSEPPLAPARGTNSYEAGEP